MTASEPSIIPNPPALPRLPLRYRARAVRLDLRLAVIRIARRLVSRLLCLSWRLQVTVGIEADIHADDQHSAQAHLEALLRQPGSRVAVFNVGGPTDPRPWRTIGSAPIRALYDTTTSFDDISKQWIVTTWVTASILIAAEDADDPYSHSGVDLDPQPVPAPYLVPPTITCFDDWEKTRTLTPVRRRHPR